MKKITLFGKKVHLGLSKNKKTAAEIYNKAALKYFGEYSYQNNL